MPKVTTGRPYFKQSPSLGHIHCYHDQLYTCAGEDTLHGYRVLVWKTHCADCGAPFSFKVSPRSKFLPRRCDAHKTAKKRVAVDAIHPAAQGWYAEGERPVSKAENKQKHSGALNKRASYRDIEKRAEAWMRANSKEARKALALYIKSGPPVDAAEDRRAWCEFVLAYAEKALD